MKRRTFITNLGLLTGALIQPVSISHASLSSGRSVNAVKKSIVLIHLRGGNDWHNTVVPYRSQSYYDCRPHIAISVSDLIKVDAHYGLHPALESLYDLYRAGNLEYIGGISSTPPRQPIYSHDEALAVWHDQFTASLTNFQQIPTIYTGSEAQVFSGNMGCPYGCVSNFDTQIESTIQAISTQRDHLGIYHIVLDGFDTHAFQTVKHGELLHQFNQGIKHLTHELAHMSKFEDTLIVSYSEMGRSRLENNRKGTNHGDAGALIAISGRLKKGQIMDAPIGVSDVFTSYLQLLMKEV